MMITVYAILFIFIFLYASSITRSTANRETQIKYMMVLCIIYTIMIAFRDPFGWLDTSVYVEAFNQSPSLFTLSSHDEPWGYTEYGFFLIGVIVKIFTSNVVIYLGAVGAISMTFLYKDLKKYCVWPLIGLGVYTARFLTNRDFVQIRSGVAILMIMWATQYILKKDWKRYFLVVALAYTMHHLALIAVPFYFFNMIKFKRTHIIIGLVAAIIFSQVMPGSITSWVDSYSEDLEYSTYTQGGYVEQALGLSNPMIWYQIGILLIFSSIGKGVTDHTKYYQIYLNGYFYSTLILILFNQYTALSGRTSTVFATFEMFMIPLMGDYFKTKKLQSVFYLGVVVCLTYFFVTKLHGNYAGNW